MTDHISVPRELLERAISRAAVFDDGSDGADAESARSVVGLLRAALLAAQPVGQSLAAPDGYALVPVELTAENGAKHALLGEFSIEHGELCPECSGFTEFDEHCECCDGEGEVPNPITIDWSTIKEIWKAGIDHFAPKPAPTKEKGN